MTSRTSSSIDNRSTAGFIRRQRELFRRRLWPAALTFVSYLLYHVAGGASQPQSVSPRSGKESRE